MFACVEEERVCVKIRHLILSNFCLSFDLEKREKIQKEKVGGGGGGGEG